MAHVFWLPLPDFFEDYPYDPKMPVYPSQPGSDEVFSDLLKAIMSLPDNQQEGALRRATKWAYQGVQRSCSAHERDWDELEHMLRGVRRYRRYLDYQVARESNHGHA